MADQNKLHAVEVNLQAFGFAPDRIDAALAALGNEQKPREPEAALLTPDDLCQQLGISRTTLWRLDPPFIQVGGRKRYARTEVMTFLAKQTNDCGSKQT